MTTLVSLNDNGKIIDVDFNNVKFIETSSSSNYKSTISLLSGSYIKLITLSLSDIKGLIENNESIVFIDSGSLLYIANSMETAFINNNNTTIKFKDSTFSNCSVELSVIKDAISLIYESIHGQDGDPGANGLSAYQIAVNNGFVGTEVEWIASLEGNPGDPGYTPVKGVDYFDGNPGADGDNAYVYIAYASNSDGDGFTTIFNPSLDYIAVISRNTEIQNPQASDFIGKWKKYKGEPGGTGSSSYMYIAYASDDQGTNFTNVFDSNLSYIAVKNTNAEIASPQASDFVGLWVKYKGTNGIDGIDGDNAYVYIAYASDDQGTGFTTVFNENLNYIAIKATTIEIPSPQASDFTGLWKMYSGSGGIQGLTASADELNVLDGIPATLTSTEIGYLDGVTSSIQNQIDNLKLTTHGSLDNRIINGCFRVSQGGATFTSTYPYSGSNFDDKYNLDRWYTLSDGSAIINISQESVVVPNGHSNSIKLLVNTNSKKFGIAQIIENINCNDLIGGEVTLAFQAKVTDATKLNNIKAAIVSWNGANKDVVTSDIVSGVSWGTAGVNPTLIANATFENTPANLNVTTDWQKFVVSANIDTANTKNLIVFIWSDGISASAATQSLYIADVGLIKGNVANPTWISRSLDTEKNLCYRYRLGYSGIGDYVFGSTFTAVITNPIGFRTNTVTLLTEKNYLLVNSAPVTDITMLSSDVNGRNVLITFAPGEGVVDYTRLGGGYSFSGLILMSEL